ncbi:CpaF family protein [Citricoccus muralis]|uniref:ATPase, T2SS/T4P/T4SS family n=1 Tax=Citricoccus muralis TaxID=169134 RepID=A0ABY8H4D3_9MICC|nr:ATPase, T2SS/T4P/T4SS family [Citricoccus muralis]WFP15996.1 ATPase, T2SS/T4P/T4SS family [Citricoccus muralis]
MSRAFVPAAPSPAPALTSNAARDWAALRAASTPDASATRMASTHGVTPPGPEVSAEAVLRHTPTLSYAQARQRMQDVDDALVGLGPLAGWARTEGITDLMIDAAGQLWTDGADGLQQRAEILDADTVQALAVRLLHQAGRRLDAGQPFADAQIGGSRVHAVLPPISTAPQLSIRLPSPGVTLETLSASWPHREQWLSLLRHLVQAHATLLVSGATGSGKTTLMAALLGLADAQERLITVEDTRELRIQHPHVVSLQTREPNAEGGGRITLADLIRQALRMRPDRLIIGECRGAEIGEFLAALNTGHRGAIGTLHANSVHDVPARLHAMGALAGLEATALRLQARSAIDAVIHLGRSHTHGRHPVELGVLEPSNDPEAPLRMITAIRVEEHRILEGPGLHLLEDAS